MSKIIAVDCDEVLVESVQWLITYARKYHNYDRNYSHIKDYFLSNNDGFNISKQEALNIFDEYFSSNEAKSTTAVGWAYQRLIHWKNIWYKLIIITARNKKAEELTTYQIEKHYPNIFPDIHFVSHYTEHHIPKSQVCINIWASLLIEDNLDYTLDVVECDIPCILLNKPWNNWRDESHNLITKVDNRNAIANDPSWYFID